MARNRRLAEFGADRGEWIPYWETEGLVACEPEALKVSVHRRSDGAMVCAIANPTMQEVSGYVDFSGSAKLSVKTGATCQELVSGQSVRMEEGKVYVTLPAYEQLLVRIE
jgi:hypothetical protein